MGGKAAVKALVLAVAWWTLEAGSALGFSSSWTVYTNPRFGYTVDVPADFSASEAPENNDGRTFSPPGRQGSVAVYGSFNALGHSPEDHREWLKEGFASAGGKARVTYEATGKTWCVLSGFTAEGAIFYQRVRFSADGDALIAVHFVYPEEDKEEWDPVVERMGKTLRFVDAEGN